MINVYPTIRLIYNMKQVFIVGQVFDSEKNQWCMQGVYDSQEKAEASCAHDNYFVWPIFVNVPGPHGSIDRVGSYYPRRAKSKPVPAIIEKLPGRSKPKRKREE